MDSQQIRLEREALTKELAAAEREVAELEALREQAAFATRANLPGAQAELARVDGLLETALRRQVRPMEYPRSSSQPRRH